MPCNTSIAIMDGKMPGVIIRDTGKRCVGVTASSTGESIARDTGK